MRSKTYSYGFQAVRAVNGEIVERDNKIYRTFEEVNSRLQALIYTGGDWGFEVVKNA